MCPFQSWKGQGPEKLRRVSPSHSVTVGTAGLLTCSTQESPGSFLLGSFISGPCNASFQDSEGLAGAQPHTVCNTPRASCPTLPGSVRTLRPMKKGSDVPNAHAWLVALLPLPPAPAPGDHLPPPCFCAFDCFGDSTVFVLLTPTCFPWHQALQAHPRAASARMASLFRAEQYSTVCQPHAFLGHSSGTGHSGCPLPSKYPVESRSSDYQAFGLNSRALG